MQPKHNRNRSTIRRLLAVFGLLWLGWTHPCIASAQEIELAYGCVARYDVLSKLLCINTSFGPIGCLPFKADDLQAVWNKRQAKSKYGAFKFHDNTKYRWRAPALLDWDTSNHLLKIYGTLGKRKRAIGWMLTICALDSQTVEVALTTNSPAANKLIISLLTDPDERFYGMGEQPSHVEWTRRKAPVFTEEQGLGRGDQPFTFLLNLFARAGGNKHTSYCAVPFWLTNRKRGIEVIGSAYMTMDQRTDDRLRFTVWSDSLVLRLYQGHKPLDILTLRSSYLGRMPALPNWAYGAWLGLQGGRQRVDTLVKTMQAAGVPVSALWLQDWVGRRQTKYGSQLWWRWQPDDFSYPNFRSYCDSLNQKGIKVLGYINSFLAVGTPQADTAVYKSLVIKDKNDEPYVINTPGFPAYLLDLTNPKTEHWLKQAIQDQLIGNGLSGWMADYGEWLPFDCKLNSGEDPATYHNLYPVEWARINREAIQEAGLEGEVVFFVRSGWTGVERHTTLFWAGDQMVNWGRNDGIASVLPSLLSSGLSGISLNHSDIGGYTTVKNGPIKIVRTPELLIRWAELSLCSPVFRTHEGLIPAQNAQAYDSTIVEQFAKLARVHSALMPYYQSITAQCTEKGWPFTRPLFLHFPQDFEAWNRMEQCLVGADLLCAPVVNPKQIEQEVYLPQGQWCNVYSGAITSGPTVIKVAAPLGQLPAFVRQGSLYEQIILDAFQLAK